MNMIRPLPTRFTAPKFSRLLVLSAFVVVVAAALFASGGRAASPASGTLTTANTSSNPLRYTAGPFNVPNATGFAGALQCTAATPCDDYALDVDVPAGLIDTHQVRVAMTWPNPTADFDFRIYLRNANGTAGEEVLSIGTSADPEVGVLPAVKRSYLVRVIPFAPLGQSVSMAISFEPKAGRFNQATGVAPRYANYQPQGGLGTDAAEPTLGVNWKTGKVMFIAGLETLRVTFNNATSPATATWEDKSFLLTSLRTLDPILYTDNRTGRTIVSQLAGTNSLSALTDDDGETWIPNEGGPLTSGVDHQTIGGGPYHAPLNGGTAVYPNAVYYCSQDLVTAFCARSDDGGLTYGPTIPMQILTCGGIHGHVQVAPDGTVYVPHRQCNSNQAVVVSEDNGITWAIRTVADTDQTTSTYDSIPGDWDPAVGVGSGGTVYFGYENGDGTPHIAVSHDRGQTWVDDQNVGIPYGIRNTAFPTVIAGDDDRAAFAFHGSTDADNTDAGVWHLYVATTYDRGKTWTVTNATPNDPVQRGSICTEGFGVNACAKGDRNLLDFMDIQVDKEGRVLVGYADGCVGCSSPSGSRSKLATIARQTCGRRLFKQFDPATDDCGGTSATPTPTPTPTPIEGNGCVLPGAKIVTDLTGDQTGAPNANQQQDIESISIAEQYPASGGQLVVTMKLNQLDPALLTPNASWTTLFNATHADGTSTTYFVSADNNSIDNPAGISFNYGFVDVTNQNLNTSVGAADNGVIDAATKTIRITVALNKLKKPVAGATGATLSGAQVDLSAGKKIVAVNGRTSLLVGALGTGLISTIDTTASNEYTFSGQAVCTGIGATPTPTPTATPTPTPTPTATPTPTSDARCIVPGLEVFTDAAGDQTGAPNANASQDIKSVSIAEQYPASGGQLVFTMKVGDLTSTITPNASWRVAFNATHADNTFTTYFVTVASNSTANPTGVSYNYGFVDTTRNNLNSTVGTADGGSMSADNDTLTVVLNMNKLRKPVAAATGQTLTGAQVDLSAGKSLGAISGATSVLVGALGTGLNVNVDSTGTGNYTMAGALLCPFVSATPTPTPTGGGVSDPARFHIFAAPAGVAESAGEPSIGVNWKTERTFGNSSGLIPNGGTVTYFGGFLPYMLRVTFDDSVSPAKVTWDQANLVVANAPRVFGDPILFTDSKTGRTFVSQELGLTPLGSTMEFTDDDGRTFTPSTGSGAPSGIDHQTVGGGPFAQPIPAGVNPVYPHGVWYCSQSIADAVCALSLDGGITFGPSVPMFTLADCVGLHGHIKIGADGTAYVPNKGCGGALPLHDNGKQALILSEDNGITWKIRPLPNSSSAGLSQDWDPSVGVTSDGKSVYFGYRDINGRARAAVTHDKGVTWVNDQEIGTALGIKKIAFPAVVAGDGGVNTGRAAFAFYGSTTDGLDTDANFPGIWHLYVATTYDGGKTWSVANATPNDPIQRGGITHADPGRNMLDFFDATIDKRGRVLIGYDDGCIGACVQSAPNSYSAKATIARQSGGKRMFAAFDPPSASLAGAPAVAGSRSGSTVNLSWSTPDNGGSAITAYKVYRRSGATVTMLGSATGTTFTDTAYAAGQVYRVTAVNSVGESAYKEFDPSGAVAASACEGAGVLVTSDVNNEGGDLDTQQNTPPDARVNIKSLFIAEPYFGAGANKLVFTLKVAPSTAGNSAPPSSQWFIIWNSRQPDADFDRRYVAMLSDAQGNVRFEYGKFGAATPLDGSAIPSPNTNQPVKLGVAQGNYDPANGTITITLPTSDAEGVTAGQSLSGVNARTFFARPEAGVRNAATASDITGDGTYTLVGNASCSGASSSASAAPATAGGFESVAWQIAARVINFTL
jgi:hypothetical protein